MNEVLYTLFRLWFLTLINAGLDPYTNYQRPTRRQGGKGEIREDGGEDAQEKGGETEEEGKEEQVTKFMKAATVPNTPGASLST